MAERWVGSPGAPRNPANSPTEDAEERGHDCGVSLTDKKKEGGSLEDCVLRGAGAAREDWGGQARSVGGEGDETPEPPP